MGADIVNAHDIEAVPAVFRAENGVEEHRVAAVRLRRDVPQLRLKAKLILELVVLIYHMGLNGGDFARAVRKVDQALVAKLELTLQNAVVAVGDQVGLPQRRVRLKAQLCGGHHGAQKALGSCLGEFGVGRQSGEGNACEALRRQHGGESFCDFALHFLNIVLHFLGLLRDLCALRGLNGIFFHPALSSLILNVLNLLVLKYAERSKCG